MQILDAYISEPFYIYAYHCLKREMCKNGGQLTLPSINYCDLAPSWRISASALHRTLEIIVAWPIVSLRVNASNTIFI